MPPRCLTSSLILVAILAFFSSTRRRSAIDGYPYPQDPQRGGLCFSRPVALLSLFPFVWMVISATNVSNEISKGRMSFGPALMENYASSPPPTTSA